jgi:hypothetical protein
MSKGQFSTLGKESYDSRCAKRSLYYKSHCVYVRRIAAGVTTDELEAFLLLRLNRAFSKDFSQRNIDPSIKNITFHCSSYDQHSLLEAVVEFEDIKCSEFALNLKSTQLRNQIMEIRPFSRRLFVYPISLDVTAEELGKKFQERLCIAFPHVFPHSPNISVSFVSQSRSRKHFKEAIVEFDDLKTVDFVLRLNTVVLRGGDLFIKAAFKTHDAQPQHGTSRNKRQRCLSQEEVITSSHTGPTPKQHDRDWNNAVDDGNETWNFQVDQSNLATNYRALLVENVSMKNTISQLKERNESLQIRIKNAEQAENEASSRIMELEVDLRSASEGGTMKQLELEQHIETLQKSLEEMERVANEAKTKNCELEAARSAKKQQDLDQSKRGDCETQVLRSQLRDSERRFLELTQCFTEQSKTFAQERRGFRDELNRERTRSESLERKWKELRSPHVDLREGPTVPTVKEEHD